MKRLQLLILTILFIWICFVPAQNTEPLAKIRVFSIGV